MRPRAAALALVLAAGFAAPPASAQGVTIYLDGLDEIVERQPIAASSLLFGRPLPEEGRRHSVSLHPFFGVYGGDGVLGGLGLGYRQARPGSWVYGGGVAFADAGPSSWTVAGSASRPWLANEHNQLRVEASLAWQWYVEDGGRDAVLFGSEISPPSDEVLIESLHLAHLGLQLAWTADLWLLRPHAELGVVASAYDFAGREWDGRLPAEGGAAKDERGLRAQLSGGVGLSLLLDPLRLFGGMFSNGEALAFQFGAGWVF